MRERGPRQPSNVDLEDRETLAILGHQIERWDLLKDPSRTFEERKEALFNDLEAEIVAINARLDDVDDEQEEEILDFQAGQLFEEQEELGTLENTQEAFDAYADERAAYYIELRDEFLKKL